MVFVMVDAFCDTQNKLALDMNYLRDNILRVPRETQEAANNLVLRYFQNPVFFSIKQANFAQSIVSKLRGPQIKEELGSFERVVELFESARRHSKYPKIRLQLDDGGKVVISVAGPNAAFPGTLNVSDGGGYGNSIFYGRVTKDGQYQIKTERKGVKELLQKLSHDPLGVAKAYGRLTGICCCCGRELTDPVSVERGLGPICESNFGM